MKKVLSIFVVVLFMSTSSSINAGNASLEKEVALGNNCFGLAAWVYDFVIGHGGSSWEAFDASSTAFNRCVETIGID